MLEPNNIIVKKHFIMVAYAELAMYTGFLLQIQWRVLANYVSYGLSGITLKTDKWLLTYGSKNLSVRC